jgi:type III pantothenate kinase
MKLLIDLGNSRAKWAWLDDGVLVDDGAVVHGGRAFDGLPPDLEEARRRPDEILVASVSAPSVRSSFTDALQARFAAPMRLAATEASALGLRNGYVQPGQLGVDRWLAMIAAFVQRRTAVCVVDAGTAMTVDVVAADGAHQGGFIVPGPALMREALVGRTGGIATAATQLVTGFDAAFLGRDTDGCIRRGGLFAAACLVDGCMKALPALGIEGAGLVLTGGDASVLGEGLGRPAEIRPLLVLEGLALRHG